MHEDELKKYLIENVGTIIGYLSVGLTAILSAKLRDWLERRRARLLLHKAVAANLRLQNYLAEVRGRLDCDRLTISQFHNGEYFASGASVQKVTLTQYVVRDGVTSPRNPDGSIEDLRWTPASFMPQLLDELFRDGHRLCKDFDAPDPWVQKYQAANGNRTVVLCLVPGGRAREALGIMGFCWLDAVEPTPAQIEEMKSYAKRAALYL